MKKNILDAELEQAVNLLHAGELVAFPTETVYGLGANALSDSAVAKIYSLKERPQFNPLIVHVESKEMAKEFVEWDERAEKLAEAFWPSPLSFVLPRKKNCPLSLLVSAGMDCVALRVPANDIALALIRKSGLPLAAPSANRSGRISPTLASHVREEFGSCCPMVLDGGMCSVGIESTIIDLTIAPATILRHGRITAEELGKYAEISHYKPNNIKSPGMLQSHYAPNAELRLNANDVREGEVLMAFGKPVSEKVRMENLSKSENLEEAAVNLFSMLRILDAENPKVIAVQKIPNIGIGIAINDRLSRAAADRS